MNRMSAKYAAIDGAFFTSSARGMATFIAPAIPNATARRI